MMLEKVDSPTSLQHLYKVRGIAHGDKNFSGIYLGNFEFDQPSALRYMQHPYYTDAEIRFRSYILSVIVHEVAHCIERTQGNGLLKDYGKIVASEGRLVSEHVKKCRDLFKKSLEEILREDFADVVRIRATNAGYLEEKFSRRSQFVALHIPTLVPNVISEFVHGSKHSAPTNYIIGTRDLSPQKRIISLR